VDLALLPFSMSAQAGPILRKGRLMNGKQRALREILFPRLCRVNTPPDVGVTLFEYSTELSASEAIALTKWGYESARAVTWEYWDLADFEPGKARRCVIDSADDIGPTLAYSEQLFEEAGRCLGHWALAAGVEESTLEIGNDLLRWHCGLFDLAWKDRLPLRTPRVPIPDGTRLTNFSVDNLGGYEIWELELLPYLKLPPVGFYSEIGDAIRASCYAIEYLAGVHGGESCDDAGVTVFEQEFTLSREQMERITRLEGDATEKDRLTKKRRITSDEANIRAREILVENPTISSRDLAAQIGCSSGLISKLPAWRAVQEQLAAGARPKRMKTVSLSDTVLATTGRKDDPLQKLIAEQEADTEPSPLDDDESDKPCRVYGRR
jgi:hypothetical protein